MQDYDVAVIGAGPGGYVAALRAAARGAKTCCIESNLIGGTCLNVGCIPTKALLRTSELAWQVARAADFGLEVGKARADGPAVMQRIARVVAQLRKGVEGLLKSRKVEIIRGRARLLAPDTIAIERPEGGGRITARSVIIATGSRPARPSFLPWESGRVMTTDDATTARDLPPSVLVIGGGVIGCEFATAYAELGIPTTLVEMLDRLLPNLEDEASRAVARSLNERGVKVLTGSRIVAVEPTDKGIAAQTEQGETIEAAVALVATGRKPNTGDLGLDDLSIELAGDIIGIDERCRTSIENVYAVGDVAETRQYAHLASRMGIIAADNATGHRASDRRDIVPACVFTHPEIACVGLTEAEARRRPGDVRVARFPFRALGIAHAYGEVAGEAKIIAEPASGKIVGALAIGRHATEIIHEFALAMRCNLTVEDLSKTIHAHPTFAEAVEESAETWLGLPRHMLAR